MSQLYPPKMSSNFSVYLHKCTTLKYKINQVFNDSSILYSIVLFCSGLTNYGSTNYEQQTVLLQWRLLGEGGGGCATAPLT